MDTALCGIYIMQPKNCCDMKSLLKKNEDVKVYNEAAMLTIVKLDVFDRVSWSRLSNVFALCKREYRISLKPVFLCPLKLQ